MTPEPLDESHLQDMTPEITHIQCYNSNCETIIPIDDIIVCNHCDEVFCDKHIFTFTKTNLASVFLCCPCLNEEKGIDEEKGIK